MAILSFIFTSCFYFLLAPLAIAVLMCRSRLTFRRAWIVLLSLAVLSWGITSILSWAVFIFAPELLPQHIVAIGFRFGWAAAFVTSIPALVLYGIPVMIIRPGRARDIIAFALLGLPFIVLSLWYVPLIGKLGVGE